MLTRYLQICHNDIQFIIIGLLAGMTASYYNVYVNEHMSNIMQKNDFSNERLYELFKASFIMVITTSLRGACFTYSQKRLHHKLSCLVYTKLLNQKHDFYQKTTVSNILLTVTNDVRIVSEIISLNINVISRSVISLCVTMYLLIHISYKLTIVAFVIIPIQWGISKVYDKIHAYIMKGYEEANKAHSAFIHETISHISVVKTFAAEGTSSEKQMSLSQLSSAYHEKESILYAFNAFIVFNLPIMATIMVIMCANYLGIKEGIVTFILHNQNLYGTIKNIIDYLNEHTKCKEPLKHIIEILDSELCLGGYYVPDKDINGEISFVNVEFKYQNAVAPVLSRMNLSISAGQRIALVGKSGCGKSTMAKLLIGIIRPTNEDGKILIDGVNMHDYDNRWLKSRIGYVAQDSVLFADTIANNIAYAYQNTKDDVEYAAKMANAHDFIMQLPMGYQTKLEGTELSSLSGGQRQRIAIARALIRKPKIIILDESTSSLDPECESIVQATIQKCFCNSHANATMIIIAHRQSALEMATKIYRLEDGVLCRYLKI